MGMFNIMENDVEQIAQLMQFAEALLEYHKQCSEILQVNCSVFIKLIHCSVFIKLIHCAVRVNLQGLTETLYQKTNLASARQRKEFTPKTLEVKNMLLPPALPALLALLANLCRTWGWTRLATTL